MILTLAEFKTSLDNLNPYARQHVLSRARVIITAERVERCLQCGQMPLTPWRGDRRYCSKACKQKAYRQRRDK